MDLGISNDTGNKASDMDVINVYEKLLTNKIKSFAPSFFEIKNRKRKIFILVKYLISEKLKISPEEAVQKLTYEELKKWKLACLLKYVEDHKPIEYELDKKYVVHLIYYVYPLIKQPSLKERTQNCYKEVLSNERRFFPKNYFRDKYGDERAKICFDYLWQEILKIPKDKIVITFLLDNQTGLKILQKYKLRILTQILYFSVQDMILNMYPEIDLSNIQEKDKETD